MPTFKKPLAVDREKLLDFLRKGEIATELLVLSELTGDLEHARRWSEHITGPAPWEHAFPDTDAEAIRQELATVLLRNNAEAGDPAVVDELIDHCIGKPVQQAQHPMILKEMGLSADTGVQWTADRPRNTDDFKVIIIGAGPSGIVTAMRLKKLGIPFEILEASDDMGGTWHLNTYPGCGVDIASHYFSYSFARNPHWSRYYAKQPEILAYLRRCADEGEIRSHTRFHTEVTATRYDEENAMWVIDAHTPSGDRRQFVANVLISGAGLLTKPQTPEFEGLENFRGAAFHSAEWDHSVSLEGKRVALVGTGASGNQIGPAIAPEVGSLKIFQRSAHWNVGVKNYLESVSEEEQWLLENVPAYERWFRARTVLSQNDVNRGAQEVDPAWQSDDGSISAIGAQMREDLTQYIADELGDRQDLLPVTVPNYPPFSKRILRDNGWYKMLRRDNVELVPSIDLRFEADGIVDDAGIKHEIDVCVFATGFEAAKMLATFSVEGRGGATIRDRWGDDDPRAYLGMTVPEFPNFFILYGPNTNIGTGGSIIFQAETWSQYIVECIKSMIEKDIAVIEVRESVCDSYNERLDGRLAGMVWSVSPAATWYRNSKGRVITNMPWTTFEYWAMTRHVDLGEYELTNRSALQHGRSGVLSAAIS